LLASTLLLLLPLAWREEDELLVRCCSFLESDERFFSAGG
jgi:hypothetical protein